MTRPSQRGNLGGGTGDQPGTDELVGNQVVETFGDTTIRFKPPYSKEEAEYIEPGADVFDPEHHRCGDCVHYISGGGCHFVQGDIRPSAYCAEFYADYGVFAHDHGDHVEVNAELIGEAMAFDERDIHDFLDGVEERLQQRAREREAGSEGSHNPGDDDDSGKRRGWRRLYNQGD